MCGGTTHHQTIYLSIDLSLSMSVDAASLSLFLFLVLCNPIMGPVPKITIFLLWHELVGITRASNNKYRSSK